MILPFLFALLVPAALAGRNNNRDNSPASTVNPVPDPSLANSTIAPADAATPEPANANQDRNRTRAGAANNATSPATDQAPTNRNNNSNATAPATQAVAPRNRNNNATAPVNDRANGRNNNNNTADPNAGRGNNTNNAQANGRNNDTVDPNAGGNNNNNALATAAALLADQLQLQSAFLSLADQTEAAALSGNVNNAVRLDAQKDLAEALFDRAVKATAAANLLAGIPAAVFSPRDPGPINTISKVLPGVSFFVAAPGSFCSPIINSGRAINAGGTQLKAGGLSCSSMPMGQIPASAQMTSTLFTSPADGATLNAADDIPIEVDIQNLRSGFFSDANTEYYVTPQPLSDGRIIGHLHLSLQLLSSPTTVPDSTAFTFFKGINDAAVDGGTRNLGAVMLGGTVKVSGLYRLCSMTGSATHAPHISPLVRHGAVDDCIRVTINV